MSETFRIPLLKDHHTHPLFYAAFLSAVNLQTVTTRDEAERLIREHAQQPNTKITIAHGWRSSQFDWPSDALESLPAAAVFDVSLHSLRINQGGLNILFQNYGDAVLKMDDHDWYERNLRVVLNWFANLNASAGSIRTFYRQLLDLGVWSAEELLLVDEIEILLFDEAGVADRTRFWAAPDTFAQLSQSSQDRIAGLKLFTDGAIGSRTAALKGNYKDDPANRGMLIYDDDELEKTVESCLKTGKALSIHAIGDRAIEQCVKTLEKVGSAISQVPEIRIEHAQMIDLETAIRARKIGLTLSMQPNFSSDTVDYDDRLTDKYCQANNPFRMLIDQAGFRCGRDLIFGSDGMPHGVANALQQALHPSIASQTLSLDEFKSGYCLPDESRGYVELKFGPQEFEYNVHIVKDISGS